MLHVAGFEILRELGRGSGGRVYLARDGELGRLVALKVLAPELALLPEGVERFRREARALAELDHENVVRVHRVGEDAEGRHFCALQLVDGRTLDDLIAREALSIERVARIGLQVARGLAAAHERAIVHRDVKPSNIIVGAEDKVVLVDFGLAHVSGQTAITEASAPLGTRAYLPPEILEGGAARASPASDIYSLGAVLFEALTLIRLAESGEVRRGPAPSPRRMRSAIPPAFDAIVRVALHADPEKRYPDGAALARDLEAFLEGRPISARAEPAWRRLLGQPLPSLGVLAVVLAALAAVAAIVVATALLVRRSPDGGPVDPTDVLAVRRARARAAQLVAAGESRLASGDATGALEEASQALALAPGDARAEDLRDRARERVASVPVRISTKPALARIALRLGGTWRDLGTSPVMVLLRPGTAIVRATTRGRHPLVAPVVVPQEALRAPDPALAFEVTLSELPLDDPAREDMAFVPEDDAVLGGPALGSSRREPTKVHGAAFWIERREVSVADLDAFVKADGYRHRDLWSDEGWEWRERNGVTGPSELVSKDPSVAASGVSRYEAEAYARWRGRRLPTADEWERAARGTDGRAYPWGDEPVDALLEAPLQPRTPGALAEDMSPYGLFDMGGDVAEWTTSLFEGPAGPEPRRAVVKGGGLRFPRELGLARCAARATLDPGDRSQGVGFRCASSP